MTFLARTRDATPLRKDLHRAMRDGIRIGWLADQAGVARQTLSGVNTGRIPRVDVKTQAAVFEVLFRIDAGSLRVPDEYRRPTGLALIAPGIGEKCGYGHTRTANNVRVNSDGKRVCTTCETRRRKLYDLRKARGLVTNRKAR